MKEPIYLQCPNCLRVIQPRRVIKRWAFAGRFGSISLVSMAGDSRAEFAKRISHDKKKDGAIVSVYLPAPPQDSE